MTTLAALLIVAASNPPSPSGRGTQAEQQSGSSHEHTGGQDTQPPATLQLSPQLLVDTPSHDEVSSKTEEHGHGYTNPDWWVAGGTIALVIVTTGLWVATWRVYRTTAKAVFDGEKAIQAAIKAANAAASHVNEASRAATAMESVARGIAHSVSNNQELILIQKEFWRKQMRAYLTVIIGDAIYQTPGGLLFEAKPLLINTGHTPAHNVRHRVKAEILPAVFPQDKDWSLPADAIVTGPAIGAGQNRLLSGIVSHRVPDDQVEPIKAGTGSALFVWGTVEYHDAFDEPHRTNFCHMMTWLPDKRIMGYYNHTHNDAD